MAERYKMRFEATADFCRFLNVCATKAVSVRNFASDHADVVAFDTDVTLAEIKALLERVPDGHVMVETVAPIAKYTGKR